MSSALSAQFESKATSGTDPVAVTDSYSEVIEPIDTQGYDRFTVYVLNFGGGAGNDLLNVMVETSPVSDDADLWTEVGDVLDVPLVAAGAAYRSFSAKSYKYIRVRARCAVGEGTTARFWVSAGGHP